MSLVSAADHVITVDVTGPIPASGGLPMTVQTVRTNPAIPGAVTGLATYISFYSSLLRESAPFSLCALDYTVRT